jgi:acyl-CoA synthetase (AMP-forming)/AMP-acid ligase II
LEIVTTVGLKIRIAGVAPEDRVALLLSPAVDSTTVLLGTMAAAIAAPLNPTSTPEELKRDLGRLDPRLLLIGNDAKESWWEVASALNIPVVSADELLASNQICDSDATGLAPCDPDRIATILHTSGTTGLPKRVPRPHRTLVAGARAEQESSALTPDDVLLLTTGLHAKAGQANLLGALLSGGLCIVAPGFSAADYPQWLERQRPTWVFSTAAELNLLLNSMNTEGEPLRQPNSRLRFIRTGSQAMTLGTAVRAERCLGALWLDGYGMSEVSCIAASGPTAADRREGSCGRPWAVEVQIVNEAGNALPRNAPGEVVVRGATLFPGYLDDPEANGRSFLPGGWFRTGDVGFLDAEGFLYLTGRAKEQINRGGEKIAPLEVDRALQCHPAVADAAAFGVPDPVLGEDVVAAVVPKLGTQISARVLRAWMLDHLSPFKVPRRIWFVDELPRTATGKVQRGELTRRWRETQR